MKSLPSLEQLNKLFTYDKETGTLTWKQGQRAGYQAGSMTNGYRAVSVNQSNYGVHRVAYYMGTGAEPNHIDHINGVKDDNRLDNLRSVTFTENMRNVKKRADNSSGVTGVRLLRNKWEARLSNKRLGFFADKIDAIYARYYAEVDAGYHTNHGR